MAASACLCVCICRRAGSKRADAGWTPRFLCDIVDTDHCLHRGHWVLCVNTCHSHQAPGLVRSFEFKKYKWTDETACHGVHTFTTHLDFSFSFQNNSVFSFSWAYTQNSFVTKIMCKPNSKCAHWMCYQANKCESKDKGQVRMIIITCVPMSEWAFGVVFHDSSVALDDIFWSMMWSYGWICATFVLLSLPGDDRRAAEWVSSAAFYSLQNNVSSQALSFIIWQSVANGIAPHAHYNSPASHSSHSNTYFTPWTGGYPLCAPLLVLPATLLTCAYVFRQQQTAPEEPDWSCGSSGRGGSRLFARWARLPQEEFNFVSILTASSSLTRLFKTILRAFNLLLVRRNIYFNYS